MAIRDSFLEHVLSTLKRTISDIPKGWIQDPFGEKMDFSNDFWSPASRGATLYGTLVVGVFGGPPFQIPGCAPATFPNFLDHDA